MRRAAVVDARAAAGLALGYPIRHIRTFAFAGAPDGTGKGSITQVFSRGKTEVGGEP